MMHTLDPSSFETIWRAFERGCVFCEPDPKLVIARAGRFMLTADVSPLRPGHMILHSVSHVSCGGELQDAEMSELWTMYGIVRDRVSAMTGGYIAYEHGRAGSCLSDGFEHRLCHHFHLHIMPGATDLRTPLAERFEEVPIRDFREVSSVYESYGPYLFVESDRDPAVFAADEDIERHLLRTLIARADGDESLGDWKAKASAERLVESLAVCAAMGLPEDLRLEGVNAP
jgi:diadenosine tetraphosphate (Ap4A) HIT family hydrolase